MVNAADAAERRTEWVLLAAILFILSILRFWLHSGPGPYGVDGSYYAQIARNVAEGRGLVTNVCLYHQGLDPLPAPTNIYPLWPVVLGVTGRVVGMDDAIRHLPRLFYLVALIVLYAVARRMAAQQQIIAGPFTVAHLVVVLLGLTPVFFSSTTFPYTEGLAFTMAGVAMLTCFGRGPWYALAGGILSGLATLTRSQMLMLVIAVVVARAITAVREKRWLELFLAPIGAALILVPWLLYVATFQGSFALNNLYVSYHQTPSIPPYQVHSSEGGSTAMRLKGLTTAFNPASKDSFVALFGAVALLVPVAGLHWLMRLWRRTATISPGVLAVFLSGTALSFMLVLAPQRFFREWLFGWRHGLPLIFLIALALIELMGFGHRFVRIGALVVAVMSILWGGAAVMKTVLAGPPSGLRPAERALMQWLNRQPPSTVVLTTNAQSLSVYSRANFRWAACDTPVATTRALLKDVRTDYIALYEHERQCRFAVGIDDVVQPVAMFGQKPRRILLLKRR